MDFAQFLSELPPHMKPSTETERLLMSYAWHAGHTEGIRYGLEHHHATLMRLSPKDHATPQKIAEILDGNETEADHWRYEERESQRQHQDDAESASRSIDRDNARSINRRID